MGNNHLRLQISGNSISRTGAPESVFLTGLSNRLTLLGNAGMKVFGRISGWTGVAGDPAGVTCCLNKSASGFCVLGASGREGSRRKGV